MGMRVRPLADSRARLRRLLTAVLFAAVLAGGGCRAEHPWPLWEAYAGRFLDGQGRVIDHTAQDRTTTEGEAYAMFFALVANDPGRFGKLVDWTEDNLAQGDLTLHLPAWSWGKAGDGSWHVLDPHPAADADLWMAYDLEEAGRLWHVDRYAKLGRLMAARVAQQEVVLIPGVGSTMIPGAEGFHPDPQTWYLNPSYLPPSLLAYFAQQDPQSPWGQVLESLPAVLATPQGFAMDWVKAGPAGVHASATPEADENAQAGKAAAPAQGSFDAIRVYLWLGLADAKTPGVREELHELEGMAMYLQGHMTPPRVIGADGVVTNPDGPPGFSAAVIPYLHALGLEKLERVQSDRLAATWDAKSGLYGRDCAWYYDQNLAMFESGWAEHRYRFSANGELKVKWK
jgi:endo-1,4-beta-D-glucanase Y